MFLPENRHSPLSRMFQETEQEIFTDVMGIPDWEHPNYVSDHTDTSLESVSGWDGMPLNDEEMFERAISGDLDSNFDRPLALMNDQEVYREIEAVRHENRQLADLYNQAMNLPHMQAAREKQRYDAHTELMQWATDFRPGGGADQIIGAFQNAKGQLDRMQNNRLATSLAAAHRDYGEQFEDAYNRLDAMDRRDPTVQHLVQRALASDDPGVAIIELAQNPMVDWLRDPSNRRPPPFMGGARGHQARHRAMRGEELNMEDLEHLDGRANQRWGSEADIFGDAVGHSGDHSYWNDY